MTKPADVTAASDAELIEAVRNGDAAAYGVLYERHAPAARNLARQIVRHPADVDDVVAETFARVLGALKRGNGPTEAFRPYLVTALRRVAVDLVHGQRREIPTREAELPDPGEPFVDPVVTSFDRSIIARAFASLPERWAAVLWHTEIEKARPAEVATMLGVSANGVSALRLRAREGLAQAYLQLHLSAHPGKACAPIVSKLGGYVRGRLPRRQASRVEHHLRQCPTCSIACSDLTAINNTLGGMLAPVMLGASAAGYLETAAHVPAGVPGLGHGVIRLAAHRAAGAVLHHPVASVATTAAVAAAIAVPAVLGLHAPRHPNAASPVGIGQSVPGSQPGLPGGSHGGHAPAGSGSASPSRSVVASRGKSGSPRPTSSPKPSASPHPTVSASAKLSVTVQVNGLLNLGVTALVTVSVSDPGTARTSPLTATITLPTGISLLGLVSAPSWSCTPSSSGQTCTHPPIAAGATSNLSFNVLVANLNGCGSAIVATVVSGSLSATGQSPQTVACSGLP